MTRQSSRSISALAAGAAAFSMLGLPLAAGAAQPDACALVSAAMLAKLAPGLGAGHPSAVPHPAGVSTCVWSRRGRHLPALTLTVAPADASGVLKELKDGFGHMGYRIVPVAGLGNEAAAAIQQANPKHGLAAGVAELAVRVGKRQLIFSPMGLAVSGPGTKSFERLKRLAAGTVARLVATGGH